MKSDNAFISILTIINALVDINRNAESDTFLQRVQQYLATLPEDVQPKAKFIALSQFHLTL